MLRRRRITDLLGQTLQSRDFKNYCPHIVIDVSMSLNKQRSHIHKNSLSFKFQSHEGFARIENTRQWNIRLHKNQETVTVNPETKSKHTIRHSKVFVDTLEHSGDESSLFRLRNSQRRAKA
ncbi:hypothetical protein Bca4012_097639 [Brassica carinata]